MYMPKIYIEIGLMYILNISVECNAYKLNKIIKNTFNIKHNMKMYIIKINVTLCSMYTLNIFNVYVTFIQHVH